MVSPPRNCYECFGKRRPNSSGQTSAEKRSPHATVFAATHHNHPSGDPSPSQADVQMTRAIVDIAGRSEYWCMTTSSSARTEMRAFER
jgi:hypothetical protein